MSSTKTTRHGVLRSAAHLTQPPHFRTGQTAPLSTPESAERDVTRAIRASQMAAVAKGRSNTSRTAR